MSALPPPAASDPGEIDRFNAQSDQRHAAQEYVRNHMDWTVAAANTRYPPLKAE